MINSIHLRFLVIGAINTMIGYGIFSLLYWLAGNRIHYLALALISHFIAVSIAFINHKYLVFRTKAHWLREFLRFNISYMITLGLGMCLLSIQVEILDLHPLVAQALTLGITTAGSFILHRCFSFRQNKAQDAHAQD